eukprot:gene46030-59016_t
MLDDLNKLISNEQAVAKRLATYSKSVSNDSGKVLDEFLKVTEIGSTKKLYNENKSGKLLNSPSPSKQPATGWHVAWIYQQWQGDFWKRFCYENPAVSNIPHVLEGVGLGHVDSSITNGLLEN